MKIRLKREVWDNVVGLGVFLSLSDKSGIDITPDRGYYSLEFTLGNQILALEIKTKKYQMLSFKGGD